DKRSKIKWVVDPTFLINLHIKDIELLKAIKDTLNVGTITVQSGSVATFRVARIKDLQTIIEFFDKYPLVSSKLSDYLLFKQCIEIIAKKEHLTEEGLLKILGLKHSLNKGLSLKLIEAFPNITPVENQTTYLKLYPTLIGFLVLSAEIVVFT